MNSGIYDCCAGRTNCFLNRSNEAQLFNLTISTRTSTREQTWQNILPEKLEYLTYTERMIFLSVYSIIYPIALIGNIAAIGITIKRKHRHFQKTCLISLALSDFLAATALAVMCISTFSQRLLVWSLGSFMCSFLPSVPVFGVICSSAALVGIGLDRYRNVVHALKKRWNPALRVCILSIILVWSFSIGASYPMMTYFESVPIRLVTYNPETEKVEYEYAHMCLTFRKEKLRNYYICLICLVFLPLFLIFSWLYYMIAQLVWKHRKPVSQSFQKKCETSTTVETSTSQIRVSEDYSRTTLKSDTNTQFVIKKKSAQIQRKVRTFKIIIFLMFVFLILRLPTWIYDTIKLFRKIDTHVMWITKYVLTSLTLLHCALNPLMYTFLNQTLDLVTGIFKHIKEFICEVCCCCFSNAEFEEFENENPFFREHIQNRINYGSSSVPVKSTLKNPKVKFDNKAVVNMYSPESNLASGRYKEFEKF